MATGIGDNYFHTNNHHDTAMTGSITSMDNISSLPEALFRSADHYAACPAQWYRQDGTYLPITYAQLATRIRHLASGLIRAGFKAGDHIALLMENRPDWAVVDYAILSIGAVTVPLYCTYRPKDIIHVLNDSSSIAIITSGGKLLESIMLGLDSCSKIRHIYAMDRHHNHTRVESLISLEGGEIEEDKLDQCLKCIDRNTLATLAYTSGTTAHPKGVMLTHGNILTNLESVPAVIDISAGPHGDRLLSFLPLAHMLERTGSHFLPYTFGLSVAFAERPDTVAKNMMEAKPTIMVSVPRMLEVVRNRMLSHVSKQSAFKQKLFHRYFSLARKDNPGCLSRLMLKQLDKIIGQKLRDRFGGRLRLLVSGGAPLNTEVATFFEAMRLPIIEGYGLSESAPLLAANPMHDRRIGSVGIASKGVELNIAPDGEILARGANIMLGYWKNPTATNDVLVDGWLHTGDIGVLDHDGYLYITDRKKDIIINSGGENIAPQRIESLLETDQAIDQAIIFGDQRPYLVALIAPNQEFCEAWAQQSGLPASDWPQLCESEILNKQLQHHIHTLMKQLNTFEQVRRIHLLDQQLSLESGLITPTLKIKRYKVYKQYGETLTSLYNR